MVSKIWEVHGVRTSRGGEQKWNNEQSGKKATDDPGTGDMECLGEEERGGKKPDSGCVWEIEWYNKGGNASSFSNQAEITGGRGREEKNKRAEYCDMSGFFFLFRREDEQGWVGLGCANGTREVLAGVPKKGRGRGRMNLDAGGVSRSHSQTLARRRGNCHKNEPLVSLHAQ